MGTGETNSVENMSQAIGERGLDILFQCRLKYLKDSKVSVTIKRILLHVYFLINHFQA